MEIEAPGQSPEDVSVRIEVGLQGSEEFVLDRGESALTQLRAFLVEKDFPANTRLPPERELSELLGVSRGDLRKALAVLEARGDLWRHVGKGTFTGARPVNELSSVSGIAQQTNPGEVMRARLALEPELAREAAFHATAEDIDTLRLCLAGSRDAQTWRQYETWDNRLHRAVAQATHNALLLAVFDTMNAVRRAVVWGRVRQERPKPPADHHSFDDHEGLVQAIEDRELAAAANRMRQHLINVQARLIEQYRSG
jgi:DNA-binding FadR family transcriptional regulator